MLPAIRPNGFELTSAWPASSGVSLTVNGQPRFSAIPASTLVRSILAYLWRAINIATCTDHRKCASRGRYSCARSHRHGVRRRTDTVDTIAHDVVVEVHRETCAL